MDQQNEVEFGKVFEAVKDLWYGEIDLKASDFMKEDLILQLGYKPIRVDILTSVSRLNFNDAYERSIEGLFYGRAKARYLDKKSLLRNKYSSGRRKDLEGIRWIKDSSKKSKQ